VGNDKCINVSDEICPSTAFNSIIQQANMSLIGVIVGSFLVLKVTYAHCGGVFLWVT
jgi:hypothetical protein